MATKGSGSAMCSGRRLWRSVSVAAAATGVVLAVAPPAVGGYGDRYGAAPVNSHPEAIQDAPALNSAPGVAAQSAFWAGACDRSQDPGIGVDLASVGDGTGFGARPGFVVGINGYDTTPRVSPPLLAQIPVAAPGSVDHCLDFGTSTMYNHGAALDGRLWQAFPYDTGIPFLGGGTIGQELLGLGAFGASDCVFPSGESYAAPVPPYPAGWDPFPGHCDQAPSWRLPAEVRAGAHPDGTTMLVWNRNREGGPKHGAVDGSADNVIVDLPPGFVGNPRAVPQCTNVQFRERPLQCPPESQVGVLRLNLELAVSASGAGQATYPVYNLEPRKGYVAELGFAYASDVAAVRLAAKARTNGDFGVTAFVGQIPAALVPVSQQITLWGVPWAAENDMWRTAFPAFDEAPKECTTLPGATVVVEGQEYLPPGGLPEGCRAVWEPSWGEIKPFLTNETDCNPAPTVRLWTDSYQNPGRFIPDGTPSPSGLPGNVDPTNGDPDPSDADWKRYDSVSPATTGCEDLDFAPDLDLDATSSIADGASGLRARLRLPQNDRPRDSGGSVLDDPSAAGYRQAASDYWDSDAGRATAHLKDSVVTLPEGMSLNPSGATGLTGCSDAEIGLREARDAYSGRRLFNNGDPFNKDGGADGAECPDASKIGTAQVDTPLLDEPLTGDVVLGEPKSTDPRSGEMLRLFIVLRAPQRGLIAKIYGSSTADGQIGEGGTGQLTTRFEANPEVPFDNLTLNIKGGLKGMLALPPRCGPAGWTSSFTSWASAGAPTTIPAVDGDGTFTMRRDCTFPFEPGLVAGMQGRQARESGIFKLHLTRRQGHQTISGMSVRMPRGLLARLRGVPVCTDAQAAAGACALGSQIGIIDGAAGSGDPFVLKRKGRVYLTEGYKGAPYGLSIVVPVEAGPFRGAHALTPIALRAAVHVDRRTAQVTVVSDPLPQVWHGVPLRVREIVATIDRDGFTLNPSDCTPKQIATDVTSAQGASASPAVGYHATACAGLPFEPRLGLRLVGRGQASTGGHPGVRAVVRQDGVGEAGIRRARVVLPRSLALDPANARALCEFDDGTRPDPENHCPRGSIVGRARAVSPLLNEPLSGPVFFVKNIRIDPDTGNEIRTLPMLVVALRGEIAINLYGESSVDKRSRLVNTFAQVPDAPVSAFRMRLRGGSNGILVVTRTRRSEIDLCDSGRQVALAGMAGHNGKRHADRVVMRKPCRRPVAVRRCLRRTDSRRAFQRCLRRARAAAGRDGSGGRRAG